MRVVTSWLDFRDAQTDGEGLACGDVAVVGRKLAVAQDREAGGEKPAVSALEKKAVLETPTGEGDGSDADGSCHLGDGCTEAAVDTAGERGGVERGAAGEEFAEGWSPVDFEALAAVGVADGDDGERERGTVGDGALGGELELHGRLALEGVAAGEREEGGDAVEQTAGGGRLRGMELLVEHREERPCLAGGETEARGLALHGFGI